jgi:hypothetical protein
VIGWRIVASTITRRRWWNVRFVWIIRKSRDLKSQTTQSFSIINTSRLKLTGHIVGTVATILTRKFMTSLGKMQNSVVTLSNHCALNNFVRQEGQTTSFFTHTHRTSNVFRKTNEVLLKTFDVLLYLCSCTLTIERHDHETINCRKYRLNLFSCTGLSNMHHISGYAFRHLQCDQFSTQAVSLC